MKTIFKQDENGQWRPVPLDDAAFDRYGPTSTEPAAGAPEIPDYFFSNLQLDGIASDSAATLRAVVTIEVVTADRWLKVPLRFDQGLLLDVEHTGVGEAAPDPSPNRNEGISWLLRGQGEHRLRLSFRIPLRRTPEGHQLQLQLPKMGLFTGEMELRIPSTSVTVREGDDVRLRDTRTEGSDTIVSADLPGERLDLRWNVIEPSTDPVIQSPTEITLRLMENIFELSAHQEIQIRAAQRNGLQVRMPSGDFELSPAGVRLRDNSGNDHWVQPAPTDQPDWVMIPLEGVTGSLIELDWRFTAAPAKSGSEIVIDGFDVAEARQHTGTVWVENHHGYRVSRIEDGDVWIKRIDAGRRSATLAYAFSGGQYRLALNVEPVVSSMSVTPYYFLLVSGERIVLEAAFQINVDDRNVRSVPIRWRANQGTPWTVVPSRLSAGELREIVPPGDFTPPGDGESGVERRWTLQLPELADHSTVVGFSGAYFFGFDDTQDAASFSLPTVAGARMFPGWVIVSTEDHVEVATRSPKGTMLTRQTDSVLSGSPVTLPDWTNTQPQTVYRLTTRDSETAPGLEMDVTVRSRQLTTSSVVELSEIESNLRVAQQITYRVKYGRISRVRLRIPPRLAELLPEDFRHESLQFSLVSLDGETPLETEWSDRNVSLDLPAPRLGDFKIVVEYHLVERTSDSGEESLSIPIIGSLDQPFDSLRLTIPDEEAIAVTVSDPQWVRLTTVTDGLQWITNKPVEDVLLKLDRSLAQSPLRLTMSAALLQTEIDEAGHSETTATYLMERPLRRLLVRLPDDAENPRFEWNGLELTAGDALEEPELPHQFRLSLPTETSAYESTAHRLRIHYRRPLRPIRWSQSRTIPFPVFPDGVWIEQTWWELALPPSQHLFVPPASMTPQFQWERESAFWSRRPDAEFEKIKHRILSDSSLPPSRTVTPGNVYPFMSFGSPEQVRFHSLSKSLIVFLGAGLTLTLSFLVMKVPAARHPLFGLVVGLTLTIASLWYLEPMLLLLQPAAYGLVLPVCAALLDYVTFGRRLFSRQFKPMHKRHAVFRDGEFDDSVSSPIEPQMTTTHIRPTVPSDSGVET